jgi:DNA mismatch repair ATPase MutS
MGGTKVVKCPVLERLTAEQRLLRQRDFVEMVKEVLLPTRDTEMLRQRLGIADGVQHSLMEVGEAFNVTRERVRQIESKALRKLLKPTYELASALRALLATWNVLQEVAETMFDDSEDGRTCKRKCKMWQGVRYEVDVARKADASDG